ncbi:MAG: CinA family protein [Alphaproteobacteria bacterium]|nr:CinA family protein [Alphaproteobacteria bacterium]
MFPPDIHDLARKVIESYTAQKQKIVTAESCTGGLVAAALTQIPGSSAVVERGFVAYSNQAKTEILGVMPETLEDYGAVSDKVAEEMAQGALEFSQADIAVSVTGIAGPSGAETGKPVGLVYFGLATRSGAVFHYKSQYNGDRDDIRLQATREALRLSLSMADEDK